MNERYTTIRGQVTPYIQQGGTSFAKGLPGHDLSVNELVRRANALPDTEAKLAEAVELLRTLSIDPESDGITRIRAFLDKVTA